MWKVDISTRSPNIGWLGQWFISLQYPLLYPEDWLEDSGYCQKSTYNVFFFSQSYSILIITVSYILHICRNFIHSIKLPTLVVLLFFVFVFYPNLISVGPLYSQISHWYDFFSAFDSFVVLSSSNSFTFAMELKNSFLLSFNTHLSSVI